LKEDLGVKFDGIRKKGKDDKDLISQTHLGA